MSASVVWGANNSLERGTPSRGIAECRRHHEALVREAHAHAVTVVAQVRLGLRSTDGGRAAGHRLHDAQDLSVYSQVVRVRRVLQGQRRLGGKALHGVIEGLPHGSIRDHDDAQIGLGQEQHLGGGPHRVTVMPEGGHAQVALLGVPAHAIALAFTFHGRVDGLGVRLLQILHGHDALAVGRDAAQLGRGIGGQVGDARPSAARGQDGAGAPIPFEGHAGDRAVVAVEGVRPGAVRIPERLLEVEGRTLHADGIEHMRLHGLRIALVERVVVRRSIGERGHEATAGDHLVVIDVGLAGRRHDGDVSQRTEHRRWRQGLDEELRVLARDAVRVIEQVAHAHLARRVGAR